MPSSAAGRPHPAKGTRHPEGTRYTYRDDGHELALSLRAITDGQVLDLHRGDMELALVIDEGEIVFCARFGATIPWCRADPFRWREVPRGRRLVPPAPEVTPGLHALLRVVLIEAGNGRVRARRGIFLTPAFTTALHAAIRGQSERPAEVAGGRRGPGHPPGSPAARLYRLYRGPAGLVPEGLIP